MVPQGREEGRRRSSRQGQSRKGSATPLRRGSAAEGRRLAEEGAGAARLATPRAEDGGGKDVPPLPPHRASAVGEGGPPLSPEQEAVPPPRRLRPRGARGRGLLRRGAEHRAVAAAMGEEQTERRPGREGREGGMGGGRRRPELRGAAAIPSSAPTASLAPERRKARRGGGGVEERHRRGRVGGWGREREEGGRGPLVRDSRSGGWNIFE